MSVITPEEIKDLGDKLKIQYPNWATLISERISKEKDWKGYKQKGISVESVHHIYYGTTKTQLHRRLFMKCGAILLLEAAGKVEEIKELVEEIKDANN